MNRQVTSIPRFPMQDFMLDSGDMQRRVKSGANNFYWIAGLSVANSIAYILGGGLGFVVGLAITQVIDILALDLGHIFPIWEPWLRGLGIGIDVFIACVFALFGVFGRRGYRWPFIAGMVLYGLDTILVGVAGDFIGFGFHVFFMWLLFSGYQTLTRLVKRYNAPDPDPSIPKNLRG